MRTDQSTTGRMRQIAFFVWAAIFSLFFVPGFIILTAFTISLWLTHQNVATTPVGDLSFFALGTILIGVGFAVQLRAPERRVAGVQQVILALLALAVAGLLGARIEPLVGALLFLLVAAAILVALHPARRRMFALGTGVSTPLMALSLLAALPVAIYAAQMLILARQAGASCFLGRCAHGDRFAELAACAVAIVLVAALASLKTPGWRVSAWSAGAAAILIGAASLALPDLPGAVGQVWGALLIAWGDLVVGVAEWEARQTAGLSGDGARRSRPPTT